MVAYPKQLAADRPIYLSNFEKTDNWANVTDRELASCSIRWATTSGPRPLQRRGILRVEYAWAWAWVCGRRCHCLRIRHTCSYVLPVMARLLILPKRDSLDASKVRARQLGIKASVFMLGFVKINRFDFQQADLDVLSSISEGLPTVIIEALATGTPIVSTDCLSGPLEMLNGERFRWLVSMGGAAALAALIGNLLAAQYDFAKLVAVAHRFPCVKSLNRYASLLFPRHPYEQCQE